MINRRALLGTAAGSFAGLALSDLLARDGCLSGELASSAASQTRRSAVHGGRSQSCRHLRSQAAARATARQPWDPGEKVELFQSSPGDCLGSPWKFRPYGESGKMLSDVVAPLGNVVDQIAFVHDMVGKTGVHSQGTLLQTTGFNFPGFPSAGAWVSYALGAETDNLPAFVVLPDHRGLASNGAKNWSTAFLPAEHQGTVIRPGNAKPIADLFPPQSEFITEDNDRAGLEVLSRLNAEHARRRAGDDRLSARVRSYELAAAMQLSATDALNLESEPEHIQKLYGLSEAGANVDDSEINEAAESDFFGRKCLLARRLLERGVRFVQIWSGNDNGFPRRNWDSHENVERDHGPLALGMSRGTAGLIRDLEQRGMLDDTLILWTTEFGRMPCSQGSKGRDHNPFVFTNWMCGGGITPGVYGESDEWGYKPLQRGNGTTVYDIHATVLHLLGIDHTRLTVRNNGIDRRLTDVHGHVLADMLG